MIDFRIVKCTCNRQKIKGKTALDIFFLCDQAKIILFVILFQISKRSCMILRYPSADNKCCLGQKKPLIFIYEVKNICACL